MRLKTKVITSFVLNNGLGINLKNMAKRSLACIKLSITRSRLGSFMTKNQIESMGGKIEVNSQENIGTILKYFYHYEKK
jgi:sensor histidine kinase regulating citrate/malate metabolism